MDAKKRKQLEAKGWKIGTAQEFLGLSDEELAYIDMKLSLARLLKNRRKQKGLTQQELADQLHTSQSRVANMENGDPNVTVDLLIKALLSLDVDRRELAKTIQEPMPA